MKKAIITGSTYMIKDKLTGYVGAKWNPVRKAHILEVDDDATPDSVERQIRNAPGIRNRGNFTIEIED